MIGLGGGSSTGSLFFLLACLSFQAAWSTFHLCRFCSWIRQIGAITALKIGVFSITPGAPMPMAQIAGCSSQLA